MKKILLIALILFNLITNAQNKKPEAYLPMAIENAQWIIYQSDDDGFPPNIEMYWGYKIEGDTLINNTTYKKVYKRSLVPSSANPNYFFSYNEFLFGAIRDDVPNKKVYGVQFFNNEYNNSCAFDEEFLMYDFSLNVGDLYNIEEGYCLLESPLYYLGELNLEFLFNENRNAQSLYENSFETFLFVYEGIGSNIGLFEPVVTPLGCPCINLYDYCIGTDNECFVLSLNTDEQSLDNKLKIYPNPVQNVLNIENPLDINFKEIMIYTILGKEIKILNKNNLDIKNLTNGVYFLKIITANNNTIIKKFIKY